MIITECTQFARLLDQQPDGPLPETAVAHLYSCPQCGEIWEELAAIRAAGRELGATEPDPPAYLWPALRAQLQSEGLIRNPERPGWFSDWFGFPPRFAMGGAYMALLLLAGSLVGIQTDRPLVMRLDAVQPNQSISGQPLAAGLDKTLDSDFDRVVASLSEHNAPLAISVRQNLGVVDNLIVLCEKSVRENPDNLLAREYLYGAYQQKATLLATAIDRSTMENR